MSYFTNFPSIVYDFALSNEEQKTINVKDITSNVRFRKDVLENIVAYEVYDIQPGDTFERISEKVYGTPYYHWVLMLVNERFDYLSDFPMDQRELEAFIFKKYGDAQFNIRHYETTEVAKSDGTVLLKPGLVVSSQYTFSYSEGGADILVPNAECTVPVTNYDYEFAQNELKRQIKVLAPELLDEIVNKFRTALGLE
jgi:hypothetical protein